MTLCYETAELDSSVQDSQDPNNPDVPADIFIDDIHPDGLAARDARLRLGDQIVQVSKELLLLLLLLLLLVFLVFVVVFVHLLSYSYCCCYNTYCLNNIKILFFNKICNLYASMTAVCSFFSLVFVQSQTKTFL